MTVTKFNYKEVPAAVDLGEKLGASIFMHYNFIPTGRGVGIADMDISPQEREELLQWLSRQSGKRKITLLSTAPQYSRVCMQNQSVCSLTHFDIVGADPKMGESVKFLAEFVGGCGGGRLYCALEPNGDLEPCVFIPIILGNLRKDSLLDIWHHHPALLQMRDRKEFKGNCGVCENRNICGGCRARAYGYFHDLQAPDPGCMNNLKYWNELVSQNKLQEITLRAVQSKPKK
jgi:radical SAM protein with 4Fe4S-binding SPASM domain